MEYIPERKTSNNELITENSYPKTLVRGNFNRTRLIIDITAR